MHIRRVIATLATLGLGLALLTASRAPERRPTDPRPAPGRTPRGSR